MKKMFIFLVVAFLFTTSCNSINVEPIPVSKSAYISSPNKENLIKRSSMINKAVLEKDLETLYSISSPINYKGEKITFDKFKNIYYKSMLSRGSNAKLIRDCGCKPMKLGQTKVLRCVFLVNLHIDKTPVSVLEMWEYMDDNWYWGYLDHHEMGKLCIGES